MSVHELAGQPAPRELLVDIPRLVSSYYTLFPDPDNPAQRVSFGTSGHRGSSLSASFNEAHILAVTQAICEYRKAQNITGPLYLGMDTHALSLPGHATALEVLAANGVAVRVHADRGYTPTPVISHAILQFNQGRTSGLADGIVVTPSHNPPKDGGFKYNPPHGGPAEGEVTSVIEKRANELLLSGNKDVRRMGLTRAMASGLVAEIDLITPYVKDLGDILDMPAIRAAGVRLGADPMGGAVIHYWDRIAETWHLDLTVVNRVVDPAFSFMSVDKDGLIRMDCSSPHAMAGLIGLKDGFDIAFGNDPDGDRHGIVTRAGGLMNPNHYLSVAVDYLFRNRPGWPAGAAIGKTLVSSAMIDRVAADLGRRVHEVPVGFKWFVDGLISGGCGFGGEESAGASFLRKNGRVWTTDKDGMILNLLAAEIMAVTGKDPWDRYRELTGRFGSPVYERLQAPAGPAEKAAIKNLSPEMITAAELAGDPIRETLTTAPGNQAAIGGLKVVTENGWFAARPSGTEDIYKIYTESFKGPDHLARIQAEAREIVEAALAG